MLPLCRHPYDGPETIQIAVFVQTNLKLIVTSLEWDENCDGALDPKWCQKEFGPLILLLP